MLQLFFFSDSWFMCTQWSPQYLYISDAYTHTYVHKLCWFPFPGSLIDIAGYDVRLKSRLFVFRRKKKKTTLEVDKM